MISCQICGYFNFHAQTVLGEEVPANLFHLTWVSAFYHELKELIILLEI